MLEDVSDYKSGDVSDYYVARAKDSQSVDRIGYKVLDTISYEVTYGYKTVFAYFQEAEKIDSRLRNPAASKEKNACIQISCGQFSYANILPARISTGSLRHCG